MIKAPDEKVDFFNLKYTFMFLTVYFTVIPFFFDINIKSTITFAVVLIGFLSFILAYQTKKHMPMHYRHNFVSRTTIFQLIGVLFLLNDLFSGFLNLFSVRTSGDYTASFAVTDHDSLYIQIIALSIYYIKYYFYAILMANNRCFFYFVFISQLLINFNSPTRLAALSPFIIFIIYGYYMRYIKVTVKRVVVGLMLLPFLFVVLLLGRGDSKGINFFEITSKVISNLDYDSFVKVLKTALESFKSFEYLVDIIANQFVHIESGVVRMAFMPISRSIWEDKPESISRIISKEFVPGQYSSGGGSVATIYGDTFINGHLFGVILLMFFIGYISKLIYNTMLKSKGMNVNQKSITSLFYSLYTFQFLYFFRGFFSESYWKLFLMILVFYFLYIVQFRVGKIKLRNGKFI